MRLLESERHPPELRLMFDKIAMRQTGDLPVRGRYDVGWLAESILFYGKTTLILEPHTLVRLLNTIELADLDYLRAAGHVECIFHPSYFVTRTHGLQLFPTTSLMISPMARRITPGALAHAISALAKKTWDIQVDELEVRRFLHKVRIKKISSSHGDGKAIVDATIDDLTNPELMSRYVATVAKREPLLASSGAPFFLCKADDRRELYVDTNIRFDETERRMRSRFGDNLTYTPSDWIVFWLNRRADLFFAAELNSDITSTNEALAAYGEIYSFLNLRLGPEREQMHRFFDEIVGEASALREHINANPRARFKEFREFADEITKFHHWLQKDLSHGDLVKRYIQESTRLPFLERLPGKMARFAFFAGLGVAADLALPTGAGILAGLGLGAGDAFLLDKHLRGWKPHQFIQDKIGGFVEGA